MLLCTATFRTTCGSGSRGRSYASLDHADMESTWAGHGRALRRSSFFGQHGTLVASVVQEGLMRER